MRSLLRAPRQPYRVYFEEEFLAAEDWCEPVEAEPAVTASEKCAPRPWGRAVVLVALSAVVVAVTGVVAMNEARSRAGSGRRFASRRIVPRLPREDHATSSLPTGRGSSDGNVSRRLSAGWASATARPVAERDAHVLPRLAAHTSIHSQPRPPERAAISAPAAPRTVTGTPATVPAAITTPATTPAETAPAETATAETAPAATATPSTVPATTSTPGAPPVATATTAMAASDAASARGASSEFGFER